MPRPAPRRLAPHPYADSNIPALSAAFLGPLSILLTFLSAGGFLLALPCGLGAMVLGSIGVRNAEVRTSGHRTLARIGRLTGFGGAIIALIALAVYLLAAAL
jgi:hypothetical protein